MQWQQKIAALLFKCPYVHMVFTMPRELHTLSRANPYQIYNCILRSAWLSVKKCCEDRHNVGAVPGAIMVLHTFGSDLKYHVHVHALISFGGMDKEGQWHHPKRKKRLIPYRRIRNEYRSQFLSLLEQNYDQLISNQSFSDLKEVVQNKTWCVHAEFPTSNTKHLEEYLGRYICRIGLSKSKFLYDEENRMVHLKFKDYKNQDKKTKHIPIATKTTQPLVAIDQIMQHCLPKYFQKCRYYGLHASASCKKYENLIPQSIKNNAKTIRTVFQIITQMMGLEKLRCDHCNNLEFEVQDLRPDSAWNRLWSATEPINKGSPTSPQHTRLSQIGLGYIGTPIQQSKEISIK